nr:hypothetical protein CFP56_56669 [Quercus suber]
MSDPNDEFWTYDFDNAYFSNDYEMQCEDNDFDDDYLNPDGEMFNGSYDFDDPFFNQDADMHGCCNDTGHGCLNPDHDILHNNGEEEEFDYINGLVGEMASYVQRHYNKRSMRTSILTGSGYMEKVRDGNLKQCFEMFRMSLRLFYHFVDELKRHGYLKEGKGHVNVQKSVAMFFRSDELFHTWENANVSGGAGRNSGNGSTGSSASTTTRRHVRTMSDQAKHAMNQFRDDITDRMWTDYERRCH